MIHSFKVKYDGVLFLVCLKGTRKSENGIYASVLMKAYVCIPSENKGEGGTCKYLETCKVYVLLIQVKEIGKKY